MPSLSTTTSPSYLEKLSHIFRTIRNMLLSLAQFLNSPRQMSQCCSAMASRSTFALSLSVPHMRRPSNFVHIWNKFTSSTLISWRQILHRLGRRLKFSTLWQLLIFVPTILFTERCQRASLFPDWYERSRSEVCSVPPAKENRQVHHQVCFFSKIRNGKLNLIN